jgi:tetratricopeptide (TPR) repeat protein
MTEQKTTKNMFRFDIKILALIALVLVCGGLLLVRSSLVTRLDQIKMVLAETQQSARKLQEEKEKILKDNEKFQVDTLSYIALNNELQKEKEDLQAKVTGFQKSMDEQKKELALIQKELAQTRDSAEAKKNAQHALLKEKEKMLAGIKRLQDSINKERGIYHYNLAVAYTKATFINKAIQEYEKSLAYDNGNAEAHFNLGLLYKGMPDNADKALMHFKKYLELKPDADDSQEVQDSIDGLILHNNEQLSILKSEAEEK